MDIGLRSATADSSTTPNVDDLTAADFAAQGEANFKAAKYEAAARDFRHALVDDPTNGGVLMLLGQSFFALGQYNDAAGSTELAMKSLPQDKWNAVVSNYQQLYGKAGDYTEQLRALEKALQRTSRRSRRRGCCSSFHYYYLGFAKRSLVELDKTPPIWNRKIRSLVSCEHIVAAKLGLALSKPPGSQGPRAQGPEAQGPDVGPCSS